MKKFENHLSLLGVMAQIAALAQPALSLASVIPQTPSPQVVYGTDDRLDVSDSHNPLHKLLAQSTAAMIPSGSLSSRVDGRTGIAGITLGREAGLCAGEKFADQISPAYCSGFLVGPDLLVTAGHCIEDAYDCARYSWVFDFQQHLIGTPASVPAGSVYSCSKIIARALDPVTDDDFALIQLNRPVSDRQPLQVRHSGKIAAGAELIVIGNPSGIPTKIAGGAKVRTNTNEKYFVANLDTFAGNSGSAVFDARTGLLEGILVRGETDYVTDPAQGCDKVNYCKNEECRGEDVTRITNVPIPVYVPAPVVTPSPSPRPSATPSATPTPPPVVTPTPVPTATATAAPTPAPIPQIDEVALTAKANNIFSAIFQSRTAPSQGGSLFGHDRGYTSGKYKLTGARLLGCRIVLEMNGSPIYNHSGSCKATVPFVTIIKQYIRLSQ